jgi:hypothetical protein
MSEETWKAMEKRKNLKAKLNKCKTRQHISTTQAQYSEMDREIRKRSKERQKKVDR